MIVGMTRLVGLVLGVLLLSASITRKASGESGRLDLHLDLGIGTPVAGPFRPIDDRRTTDATGSRQHDTRVSQDRANTVKAGLVAHGIVAGRMTPRGYGATPASNDSDEGRAPNRRIEFERLDS